MVTINENNDYLYICVHKNIKIRWSFKTKYDKNLYYIKIIVMHKSLMNYYGGGGSSFFI